MTYKKSQLTKTLVVVIAATLIAGAMITSQANVSPTGVKNLRNSMEIASAQTTAPAKDHSVFIKRLDKNTKAGNALLILSFNGQYAGRQLSYSFDNRTIVLRDDGRGGDEVAGDGRLSATVTLDFAELAANQVRIKAAQTELKAPSTVALFNGRVKIGEEEMELPLSSGEMRPGQEIELVQTASVSSIDPARSLLITHINVVEDPTRTFNPCTGVGTPMGKWTFGYLMEQMANQPVTGINPSVFVRQWLKHWEAMQVVNGWSVAQRNAVRDTIIIPWVQASGGPGQPLNLKIAPFRLLAIVNRIDLQGNSGYQTSSAGEARFVFGAIDRRNNLCNVVEMSVIFEYGIDLEGCESVRNWAKQWINLSTIPIGTPAYNLALEKITDQFVTAGVAPKKVNGSALNQLRTNEFLNQPWELREFKLTPGVGDLFAATGFLTQTTVKQTPDPVLNNTATLADYINSDCANVNLGSHIVPIAFPRNAVDAALPNPPAMLGGNSPVPPGVWNAPGIGCGPVPPGEARFQFSFATCGGCHLTETNTSFYHIRPTQFGTPAILSPFLSGPITVNDPTIVFPLPPFPRKFDEMLRRAQILDQIANQDCRLGTKTLLEPLMVTPKGEIRNRPSAFVH
jgi:hypothetical protein